MILDDDLKVCDSVTVAASDPDYSSAYDLTKSPDLGNGEQVAAIVVIDTYTANTSTGTTINVVTSAATSLSSPRVIGSVTLTATELETMDDDQQTNMPIVIRINPDQWSGADVSGTGERYLGLEFDHATAAPSIMTVSAWFGLAEGFRGDPRHSYHDSGFSVS